MRCRTPDWSTCLVIPDSSGPCIDDPLRPATSSAVERVRSPIIFGGEQGCSPLYRSVRACLTPALPVATDAALGLLIDSGAGDLRNLMIEWFPAFNGYPSPATCEGERFYRSMVPCNRLVLPWLQANSTLDVDGRRQQVLLSCLGSTPRRSEGSLVGWDFPTIDPACRYWVMVTADCLNTSPDMTIDLTYTPRYLT